MLLSAVFHSSGQRISTGRTPHTGRTVGFEYPERPFVALGYLADRLHVVCFTPIYGGVRIIGFRKANDREVRRYEQEAADR